ncbi:MAG: GTP 3',8-cyclase MoaA [Acidobacteriia bacterium]|nr:GTP 3',8-cyclase MoaA [Terriglobia bacterium]
MLVDSAGRTIRHLRISVTDRCQLRCRYCLPEEGVPLLDRREVLSYEEIQALVRVAVEEGITSARVTGGEPLLRRGIVSLVRELAGLEGLLDLSLTTNGILLEELAGPLREAGLARINIGLTSLDPARYRDLTRGGDLAEALAGVESAVAAGFDPVKINVVLLRGVNDDPGPFLDLTRRHAVVVRFIEYMPIGPVPSDRWFVPAAAFRDKLEAHGPFEEAARPPGHGPAERALRLPGAPGSFAFIAAVSDHFCDRCNRLRLTADGHLRLCLFHVREIDLKPALRPVPDRERLRELLREAVAEKPAGRPDVAGNLGRGMSQIGG